MANASAPKTVLNTEKFVQDILSSVERDREREIVARRFGLFDRRETLEQIGELLGITRERVRQLEKSVVARFKSLADQNHLPHIKDVETALTQQLQQMGNAARVSDLAAAVTAENTKTDQSRVVFLATLCPHLSVIEEDDHHFQAVGIANVRDKDAMKAAIVKLTQAIGKAGEPVAIATAAKAAGIDSSAEAAALASISKDLATLNGRWGLIKWPMVNPKNIRDKIYVILKERGQHMHFNEIAESIKQSDFKRKDVTTQAIHNELIKDKRFVLIGRGIYALKEWGYSKGTVADIISDVLRDAGEPLHRDEIVKRVLKSRFVKETTILLNLQGKTQFKRVAKATYTLDDALNGVK
ncbi:MAG TPA: sigma factor-like helix-turn-helix DNA-binding protein [Candidatus Saccharimonadales bacterium]|nr:sigma factor-like helix-turn-helix DNA-binding protein [Candidatus Saccharimonadales bacterium]